MLTRFLFRRLGTLQLHSLPLLGAASLIALRYPAARKPGAYIRIRSCDIYVAPLVPRATHASRPCRRSTQLRVVVAGRRI
jgi:hypothetical protein